MTSTSIASPPAITFESAAGIVQRYSDHTGSVAEPAWAAGFEAHCKIMAPMGVDRRLRYLGTAGCDDDMIRLITRAIAGSIGEAAKPALRSAAHECAEAKQDIESLLDRWPEPQHFQLLSSKLVDLNDEQISLANAYAACEIYETAATALYLAIVDGMAPVATSDNVPDAATLERDRAIADAGYADEVARWPK